MITTIITRRMTTRMTVRNARTYIHRLSLTDGPRIKCEQASITRTARQTRQQHLGGGTIGHTLFSNEQSALVAGTFSFGGYGRPVT